MGRSIIKKESSNDNFTYDFHLIQIDQNSYIINERYFRGNNHDFLETASASQYGSYILAGTSFSDKKNE